MTAFARGWWRGIAPVTCDIDRGGYAHRISWTRGRLVLHDHPDLEAEEALVALGGERCACLDVLDLWRSVLASPEQPLQDPEPLFSLQQASARLVRQAGSTSTSTWTFASVSTGQGATPAPPPTASSMALATLGRSSGWSQMTQHRRRGLESHLQRVSRQMVSQGIPTEHRNEMIAGMRRAAMQEWSEAVLAALPEPLDRRLRLAREASHIRAAYEPDGDNFRSSLGSRLHLATSYLEQSVGTWRHKRPTDHIVNVTPLPVLAGDRPTVVGMIDDRGGTVVAILEFSWVLEIEERGAAVVDGCFVVDLLERPRRGDELHVLACRWERCAPSITVPVVAPAVIARRGRGDWHLQWE